MSNVVQTVRELCADGLTLAEIGKVLGVSRQRVHQILKRDPAANATRKQARQTSALLHSAELTSVKERKYGKLTKEEFRADVIKQQQVARLRSKSGNANKSRLEFRLQWGDLEWPDVCPVLGIPIDYASLSGRRSENSASFDRLDSTQGYTKENTRVISWRANRIKNDGTAEEHRRIAEYIDSTW